MSENIKPLNSSQIIGRFGIVIRQQSMIDVLPAVLSMTSQIADSAAKHQLTNRVMARGLREILAKLDAGQPEPIAETNKG